MFTGCIKELGIVEKVNLVGSGAELVIQVSPQLSTEVQAKSNISIDGRALTVLHKEHHANSDLLKFYVSDSEKVSTYLPQRRVNLERAIRLGEEVPGSFFYGTPTGLVEIISFEILPEGKAILKVSYRDRLISYLSIKDQVCLDGVLLQIKDIDDGLLCFELRPVTLSLTNLEERQVGELLKLEIDPLIVKIAKIFEKFNS